MLISCPVYPVVPPGKPATHTHTHTHTPDIACDPLPRAYAGLEDKEKKSEDFDNIFMQRWHGMIIGQQNTQIGENMYQMMVRGSLRNMRGAREGDESERERERERERSRINAT